MQSQVDSAVTKAVAQVEARHSQEFENVVTAYDILSRQVKQVYYNTAGFVRQ